MKLNGLAMLLVLCAVGALAICSAPAQAQISGAVFTTTQGQTTVDENVYDKKCDVYLNGGPRKPGSSGLPTGSYYVKVTEPNGTLLGTSIGAPVEKPVQVGDDGKFVEVYKLCDIVISATGRHGKCGFDTTSNNGGEYKVWISMDPDFPNSESKTDNFKVKTKGPTPPAQTEIRVLKFYDLDCDGSPGDPADEPPIPNWHIELRLKSDNSLVACGLTDGGGEIQFLVDADGKEYVAVETLVGDYVNTTPLSVDVTATGALQEVVFGNVCLEEAWGLGRTPGFWQACNQGEGIVGCDLLYACDPEWRDLLNELALVYPDGDPLEIPEAAEFMVAFDVFGDWIVGTGAEGNMAYILSRQLAAVALNHECGFMADSGIVYVPCGDEMVDLDQLIEDASLLLFLYPLTPGYSTDPDVIAARALQEDLKNCLDAINNNCVPVMVVCPGPCEFTPIECP